MAKVIKMWDWCIANAKVKDGEVSLAVERYLLNASINHQVKERLENSWKKRFKKFALNTEGEAEPLTEESFLKGLQDIWDGQWPSSRLFPPIKRIISKDLLGGNDADNLK